MTSADVLQYIDDVIDQENFDMDFERWSITVLNTELCAMYNGHANFGEYGLLCCAIADEFEIPSAVGWSHSGIVIRWTIG
jgi:hypothetical protein